jgi:hypothetical protein
MKEYYFILIAYQDKTADDYIIKGISKLSRQDYKGALLEFNKAIQKIQIQQLLCTTGA